MAGNTPRWDAKAQRWQSEDPRPYAPPPPPLPEHLPDASPADVVQSENRGGSAHPSSGTGERRPLSRNAIVALGVAAVLITAGVGVWLARGDDQHRPSANGGPSTTSPTPSPTAPAGASGGGEPTPEGDPTFPAGGPSGPGEGAQPPPGFRLVEDEEGFTLAVPEEWSRTSGETGVFYTASDERSLLQIFTITEPGLTPLDAVESAADTLSQSTDDYRELNLGPVSGGPENPDGDAAELHYSYLSEEAGGIRECVERAFTATDGRKYAVLACAPAEEAPYQRSVLHTALDHFAPGVS